MVSSLFFLKCLLRENCQHIIFFKNRYFKHRKFYLRHSRGFKCMRRIQKGRGASKFRLKKTERKIALYKISEIEFRSFSTSIHSRNVTVTSYKQIKVIVTMWYGCLDLKIFDSQKYQNLNSQFSLYDPFRMPFSVFISGAILCFVPFYGRMFICGTE